MQRKHVLPLWPRNNARLFVFVNRICGSVEGACGRDEISGTHPARGIAGTSTRMGNSKVLALVSADNGIASTEFRT